MTRTLIQKNTIRTIALLSAMLISACVTPEQEEKIRKEQGSKFSAFLLSMAGLGYGATYYGGGSSNPGGRPGGTETVTDLDRALALAESTVFGLVGVVPPPSHPASRGMGSSPLGPYGEDSTPTMHCTGGNVCTGLALCSRGGNYSWLGMRHNRVKLTSGSRKTIHSYWHSGTHVSRNCRRDAVPIVTGAPDAIRVIQMNGGGDAGYNAHVVTLDSGARTVSIDAQGTQTLRDFSLNDSEPQNFYLSYHFDSAATRINDKVYMAVSMQYYIKHGEISWSTFRILDFEYDLPAGYPAD